jgi:clan AA aspartic protease (TIGR02281 family)
MVTNGKQPMGRFAVDIEVSNNRDVALAANGHLDPAKIRRKKMRAVVDSGATRVVIPADLAKELGLPIKKQKVRVRYADGRKGLRTEVEDVRLLVQGRDGIYTAVVEPRRDSVLLGAIVLEDLDFLVDCTKLRLVPRDPDHIVSEIE